jgi:hypothetical protein
LKLASGYTSHPLPDDIGKVSTCQIDRRNTKREGSEISINNHKPATTTKTKTTATTITKITTTTTRTRTRTTTTKTTTTQQQ